MRLGLSLASLSALAFPAFAQTAVPSTLSAQYFEVLNGTGAPDFGGSGTPNVAAGSALGPNGLPVVSAPAGISAVNPATQEITWWSPTLNSAVTATGTGTITLPYASNMFPPNSTGTSDSSAFETATFSGTFTLTSAEPVTFQLGSDDDSFIYVDGILIGQNPGVHAISNVNFTSGTLAMGTHTLNVFYADREQVAAYLSLSLVTQGVVTNPVPEPSTWTLLAAGLLLILGVGRRHRARPSPRRSGPGATY